MNIFSTGRQVMDMSGRKYVPPNTVNHEEESRKTRRVGPPARRQQVLGEFETEPDPLAELQHDAGNTAVRELIEHASSGASLDASMGPEVRAEIELRLGKSLRDVSIHSDSVAEEICEQSEARALTFGKDIFVRNHLQNAGQSQELLLHELTHVAQQPAHMDFPQGITGTESRAECEAQNATEHLLRGQDVNLNQMPELAVTMARTPDEERGTEPGGATSTLSDEMQVTVYTWELNIFSRLDQLILIMPQNEATTESDEYGNPVTSPAATAGEWAEFCSQIKPQLEEMLALIESLRETPGLSDLSKDFMEIVKNSIEKAIKNCLFAGRQMAHRKLFRENMEKAVEWARTEDVFEISSSEVRNLMSNG
jgi:hypothetical protein